MSVADICILASVLVVVLVVAKMLRAIRLLDGRVTLLQEQVKLGRAGSARLRDRLPAPAKPSSGKTPVQGVPVVPAAAPHTPAPQIVENGAESGSPFAGEAAAHYIDQAEADAVWTRMEAEQERLKRAMGRDFQVRAAQMKAVPARSAAAIRGGNPGDNRGAASDNRGKPAVRALSAQELARKLERR